MIWLLTLREVDDRCRLLRRLRLYVPVTPTLELVGILAIRPMMLRDPAVPRQGTRYRGLILPSVSRSDRYRTLSVPAGSWP